MEPEGRDADAQMMLPEDAFYGPRTERMDGCAPFGSVLCNGANLNVLRKEIRV